MQKSVPHSDAHPMEGYFESKEVTLHYLDWGGEGQVLILLCGLGDTPYIFDQLAQKLASRFHVIGFCRRNHGKSKSVNNEFDNVTLVGDLKLIVDSLNIDRVNLLGWSMGGNEITEFAVRYPDRVNKLIYFEAGYDLSDGGFGKLVKNIPQSFLPDSIVMSSLDNYREWYHHFWFGDIVWNDALEANLQASVRIHSDGVVETMPDNDDFKSTLTEAMNYKRQYDKVLSPALVIYAEPFFHPADTSQVTLEQYKKLETGIVTPWRQLNRNRIAKELKNPVIVDAPRGTHTSFLFLSEDFLVETITGFLNEKKE